MLLLVCMRISHLYHWQPWVKDLTACLTSADHLPATQGALSSSTDQELGEEQLNTVLGGLDKCVGSLIEALPVNGLLVVFTCQGDTAEYRRMQARLPQTPEQAPARSVCMSCIPVVRVLFIGKM